MRRWIGWAWPLALPAVTAWALLHQRRILRRGQPLSSRQLGLARELGLQRAERVRLMVVPVMPFPGAVSLHRLGMRRLHFALDVRAMTLGHGIYCVGQPPSFKLLAHELWHVRQVERAGSLRAFLAEYLSQVARHGYWNAPLEAEAREAASGWEAHSVVAGAPFSAR